MPFLPPTPIEIQKVPDKTSDRAPDWIVLFEQQPSGALWKREPRNGGPAFLSGNIESPIFPGGTLDIAIFKSQDDPDAMEMTWRPLPKTAGNSETSDL